MDTKKQAESTSNGSPTGKRLTNREFVSVHIPKTGGTVFLRRVLTQKFYKIKEDYRPNPMIEKKPKEGTFNIIHGHFPASRYLHRNVPYIVWLREPVARIISHYNWVLRLKRYSKSCPTLDEFIDVQTNVMSKYMDISIDKFIFIGILELWEDSINWLSKVLDVNLDEYGTTEFTNSITDYYGKSKTDRFVYPDQYQIGKIMELNAKDISLYRTYHDEIIRRSNEQIISNRSLCERISSSDIHD